jgi:hypothetical protein
MPIMNLKTKNVNLCGERAKQKKGNVFHSLVVYYYTYGTYHFSIRVFAEAGILSTPGTAL